MKVLPKSNKNRNANLFPTLLFLKLTFDNFPFFINFQNIYPKINYVLFLNNKNKTKNISLTGLSYESLSAENLS